MTPSPSGSFTLKQSLKRLLGTFFLVTFFGAVIGIASRLGAEQAQLLELLSHFQVQYTLALLISGLGLATLYSKRWLIATGILLIPNLMLIAPYYLSPTDKPPAPPRLDTTSGQTAHETKASFKLLSANVLANNYNPAPLRQLIQDTRPDVIALQEFTSTFRGGLIPISGDYPYQVLLPYDHAFGVALYSRLPILSHTIHQFEQVKSTRRDLPIPSIIATLQFQGQPITLIVTHPWPPMANFQARNSHLADIAQKRAQFGKHWMVVGDLNSSPWSPYFARLLAESGLRDSQMGFGVQASWPATSLLYRIPIDHVLVSEGLAVYDRRTGPNIESDHVPVIAEMGFKSESKTQNP